MVLLNEMYIYHRISCIGLRGVIPGSKCPHEKLLGEPHSVLQSSELSKGL